MLWKTSCLVSPQEVKAIRPGRLQTSRPNIACDEGPGKTGPQVRTFLDSLQFAYQRHLVVDDAVIYQLQQAHMHLDGGGGTVRIKFF